MKKSKELKRKQAGAYLSKTNPPHKTSREKRYVPPVVIQKPFIERITVIGWVLIACVLGVAIMGLINL